MQMKQYKNLKQNNLQVMHIICLLEIYTHVLTVEHNISVNHCCSALTDHTYIELLYNWL